MADKELPWQCPDHPDAKILHSWDHTKYVYNGYPRGIGTNSNHKYQCNECKRELRPPK